MDFGLSYPNGNELTLIAYLDESGNDVLTTEKEPLEQYSF